MVGVLSSRETLVMTGVGAWYPYAVTLPDFVSVLPRESVIVMLYEIVRFDVPDASVSVVNDEPLYVFPSTVVEIDDTVAPYALVETDGIEKVSFDFPNT